MAPTSSSTSSSSVAHSPDSHSHFRVVRKRNRIPLSCAPCRQRKLKCNRGHPCDNCTKRGDTESCTYASPGLRKRNPPTPASSNSPDEMQNRIDRLENLVLSLMTNGGQAGDAGAVAAAAAAVAHAASIPPSSVSGSSSGVALDLERDEMIREEGDGEEGEDSDVDKVVRSIGVMKVDSGHSIYVPESHWFSLLAEISEVKNYFVENRKQYEDQYRMLKANDYDYDQTKGGLFFPFAVSQSATPADIIRSFPPKSTTDLLISRFFNTYNYDPAFHVIHGPTYQKQYDKHWSNPSKTPLQWLGMTYAMMVIALQSYLRTGEEPPEYNGRTWQKRQEYRLLSAQTLLLYDILNHPNDFVLETLVLYVIAQFGRKKDTDASVLMGISVITRVAMKFGLHRDSKFFPAISPFQGEMKRRLWSMVRQADVLFSAQIGLPPIIREKFANTEYPRNLYDDELHEGMKALPPSRPLTEPTPMCYVIYRAKLVDVYAEILDEALTLASVPYENIMKLDQRLRDTQANIPPIFALRPIEESLRDPSALVMQRYILDLLYHKSICVLHRKFYESGCENTRYGYSVRACSESAMEMLRHQATLHNESRPGGRLHDVRWFASSLTSNDFLLASTIISLGLFRLAEAERQGHRIDVDLFPSIDVVKIEMVAVMRRSLAIWEESKDESLEAFKASGIISALFTKLSALDIPMGQQQIPQTQLQDQNQNQYQNQQHQQPPTQVRQSSSSFGSSGSPFSSNGVRLTPDDDNVAPEHSAAMTLGMLSTGGITSNTGNMFAGYDTSLNPQSGPQQTTGMTSQYLSATTTSSSDQSNGPLNAPSPFSSLFAPGFQSMDVSGTNIDWDAFDSYIQSGALDLNTNNGLWGMGMDSMSNGDGTGRTSNDSSPTDASNSVNLGGIAAVGAGRPSNGYMASGNVYMS